MQNEGIGPFTGAFSHAIIDGMVDDGACGVAAGLGLERACVEGVCVILLMSRIRFQGGNRIGLRGSFS